MSAEKAVFVDKDGTLVENVPYNVDPERIALTPGAGECVRALARSGYQVIVVSNQPGAGLGVFPEMALKGVEARLQCLLQGTLDGFYYCPHRPDAGCECRKPSPGLLLRAAHARGLDLERSWMVGDILDDVEAGRRAGCRTVLLDNGNETEWVMGPHRQPDCVARNFREVTEAILRK